MAKVRRAVLAAVALALLVPLATLGPTEVAGAVDPPTPVPTPARANDPTNMYAIGDSITTATGTDTLGGEIPANSWATGANPSVNSMRARIGVPNASAVNLASNGRRMQDFNDQAAQLPANASYVVVELGGNDLCRDSVPEMTSVAAYRQEFLNGLAEVRTRAPNALIFVASVPDIYNLWYIRGAEAPYQPNPSSRRTGLAGAHFYWDGLSVIPCQSLVDAPTDSSPAATARRLAVRQRNLDFNAVLEEECNAVLRCRFDDGNLFELSSNRIDPYANVEPGPNGYLPLNQRSFVDDDISWNIDPPFLGCPIGGALASGCGDHFHPSLQGQSKLAESGHISSFQFPDNSFPNPSLTPARPADASGGRWAGPVEVDVTATDAEGVRGFEYRVHHPNGTIDPWTTHIGTSFSVPVTEEGLTHVEARAMDVNGNLSASEHTSIRIDPDIPAALGVEKEVGDDVVPVGTPQDWTITVTNTGELTLTEITVDDPVAGACEQAVPNLAAGASHEINCSSPTSAAGEVENVVTVDAAEVDAVQASASGLVCGQDFSDVALSHPFFEDICWLVDAGVTTGFPGGTYRPAATVTRQAMAAFLYRMAGEPEGDPPGSASFSDVPTSHPFFAEVEWASAEGIVTGFAGGLFKPGDPVSRQAMAAFMYRMAEPGYFGEAQTFTDVPPHHPFFDEIEWLAISGITNGFSDGSFKPQQAVTRQSMAAFLHRLAPLLV